MDDKYIEEYVRAAIDLHDLQVDAARQAAVTDQFRLLTTMAQTFMHQASAEEEPAPIYRL